MTYLLFALVGAAIYQLVADARRYPHPRSDEELDAEELQRRARDTARQILRIYDEEER
jgi:hypothetical protein